MAMRTFRLKVKSQIVLGLKCNIKYFLKTSLSLGYNLSMYKDVANL
ncbi:hypothetical protein HanXRQr2_Chr03g0124951 [Helianthus annuus]|uniref:Uncharacterized protein n=1 Tax=Helianthus annuus TaxID=4232 RepID=A0A9K3JI38_HELAN|nr:hypothetical protein HanXRQr2_Chr03g0124951 [Helianthus annuus]